ncbi:hypothetical protein BROUX41_000582 [Berkeleyomyces rouxiae]|uniref:uncharacterized protein n=1 Tax=Berkeleyomyces rouxiae TaxID=2035830 RepID=UPI003B79C8ED
MSGPENAPILQTPTATAIKPPRLPNTAAALNTATKAIQLPAHRRLPAMSSGAQSRPASSSSAVSTPSPSIRPISRTSTAPSLSRPFPSMVPSPPSSVSFSPTSATYETSNAPRVQSSVTPSISVSDLATAAISSSAPISRTTTPPMGSLVALPPSAAAAAAAAIASTTNHNAPKPRSLKAVLQTIIDSVDEVRGRQSDLEEMDDMLLEISELKGHLEAANAEFSAHRDQMARDVASYKEKKDKELRSFKETKEKELQNFKVSKTTEIDTYKARKDLEVKTFKTTKEQELESYKAARAKELEDIRLSKTKEIEELNKARLKDQEEFNTRRTKDIEDAIAVTRNEFAEMRKNTDEDLAKLRAERDTAVFTKESLMAAFENRYAQWDIDTRNYTNNLSRIKQLEEELKNATETVSRLSSSLAELTAVHEKCASRDIEFANNTKSLSTEVTELVVKVNQKTKEATEYKKRYEKSHSRLGMLTLDTKDIADKFRDLDNSFHDLAWNFFNRELPNPVIKLTDLPGSLWSFPQVQSNSKAAQCLRSALAEALISHKLSTRIFQQFYLSESSHVGFESMRKVLQWMDLDHPDQSQAIRCQLAIVSDRLPEVTNLPTVTASELCDLLHPWLDRSSEAGKSFKEGLTLLMKRAMTIWQQMQRGSQLARAMVDSPEQRWLATEDSRERYSALTLDENLQKQQAAAMALAGPEFDHPIAVLFPQIHFGTEICFSGHALFQSQACVVAARAERNASTSINIMARRRTIDTSGQRRPLTSSSNPVPTTSGSIPAAAQIERGGSAASVPSVRPARSSSRQAVQSRISGFSHDGTCSSTSPLAMGFPMHPDPNLATTTNPAATMSITNTNINTNANANSIPPNTHFIPVMVRSLPQTAGSMPAPQQESDIMKKLSCLHKKSRRSSRANSVANDSGIGTPIPDTADSTPLSHSSGIGRLLTRSITLPTTPARP